MSSRETRVAVVGGGIAGLSLAHGLARRGVDVVVLEGGPRPGGNIRSEERQGYLCEWGPNGFLDNEPATLRLVDALDLRGQLAPSSDLARVRWIVRGGRLRRLPSSPPAFLKSDVLSPRGRARVLLEWAQPARRETSDESVFDFARRRIGREAAEVLVDAMVTGIYAGDSRRLSLHAAFPRMRDMEREHGGLFRAMRHRRGGGNPMGPGGVLTSFVGGMETLVRALAAALGDRLRTRAAAAALERRANGWHIETEDGTAVDAEQVVLACPSWRAAPLLERINADLAAAAAAIPSAPVAVVCLGYAARDLQRVEPGFGFLVPGRERLGILGTLFDTWVFPGRSPDGRVLLRTMIGGARDPGALDLPDDALVARAQQALASLLGVRAEPDLQFVVRHSRGIPQYPVGHVEKLKHIEERLQALPGLSLTGNSYRGIAMNSCIREAESLVERLA